MKKIRIGNDITIRCTITRNGEAEDLTGKTVAMQLRTPYETIALDYTAEGNVLTAVFLGTAQKRTGVYSVTIVERYGDGSMNTADECEAFALVARSCQECGLTGGQTVDTSASVNDVTEDVDVSVSVPANGLSAYEVAVRNGFEGTEKEWLASLAKAGEEAAEKAVAATAISGISFDETTGRLTITQGKDN